MHILNAVPPIIPTDFDRPTAERHFSERLEHDKGSASNVVNFMIS